MICNRKELKAALDLVAAYMRETAQNGDSVSLKSLCDCVLVSAGVPHVGTASVSVEASRCSEGVDATVSLSALRGMAKSGTSESVSIKTVGGDLAVDAGVEITLRASENATTGRTVSRDLVAFRVDDLAAAAKLATIAISRHQTRFTLNSALLEVGHGNATLVSTDGHRMVVRALRCVNGESASILVPRQVLTVLAGLTPKKCGGSEARLSSYCRTDSLPGEMFSLVCGRAELSWPKQEGTFPDYKRVLESAPRKYSAQLAAADVVFALKQLAPTSKATEYKAMVEFNDALTIKSLDCGPGSKVGTATVRCDYNGPDFTAILSGRYVSEYLELVNSKLVEIQFGAADRAFTFTPVDGANESYVLMPMREV